METKYRTCCTANAPLLRAQQCAPFTGARRGPPAGNPVKYGVKNLKRIGTIRYSRNRPADYWAEEGYDWYCGL